MIPNPTRWMKTVRKSARLLPIVLFLDRPLEARHPGQNETPNTASG
jgi:hypothetical protein